MNTPNPQYPVSSETWYVNIAGPLPRSPGGEYFYLMLAMVKGSGVLRAEYVTGPDQLACFLDRAARHHQRTPARLCCDYDFLRYLAHWHEQGDCEIHVYDPHVLQGPRAITERHLLVLLRAAERARLASRESRTSLESYNEALASVLNVDYDQYFAALTAPTSPHPGGVLIPQAGVSTPDPAGGPS